MLRNDEKSAWNGFLTAAPGFAGEAIAKSDEGPDPPDMLCKTVSGKTIGIELTKWIDDAQITSAKGGELLERSYLKIIASQDEPRPEHIGNVFLDLKSQPKKPKNAHLKPKDVPGFRTQLFDFLVQENAKPEPSYDPQNFFPAGYSDTVRSWNSPQGAQVSRFSGYPMLEKYLDSLWIYPRGSHVTAPQGLPWVVFKSIGGSYTPESMVQAAVDRIQDKITMYANSDLRNKHSIDELDLLCFYCYEAFGYNSPIHAGEFGFQQAAANVKQRIATAAKVFDRIFLYHSNGEGQVVQVYGKV